MLTVVGDDVAVKSGMPSDIVTAGICSFFDCCTCYSCSVLHQSRILKAEGAGEQQQTTTVATVVTEEAAAPEPAAPEPDKPAMEEPLSDKIERE